MLYDRACIGGATTNPTVVDFMFVMDKSEPETCLRYETNLKGVNTNIGSNRAIVNCTFIIDKSCTYTLRN